MPTYVYAGQFVGVALIWYGIIEFRPMLRGSPIWAPVWWWLAGAAYTAAMAGFLFAGTGFLPQVLAGAVLLVSVIAANRRAGRHG